MKNLKARIAAAWARVPASVKREAAHVLLTFVVAFVVVAAPALPALALAIQAGQLPALSVVHALVVSALAAGLKAAIPAARASVVALVQGFLRWAKSRKDRRLQVAVEAYLAVKAAAEAQAAQSVVVTGGAAHPVPTPAQA